MERKKLPNMAQLGLAYGHDSSSAEVDMNTSELRSLWAMRREKWNPVEISSNPHGHFGNYNLQGKKKLIRVSMRLIFHRHYRPHNPFKSPFLSFIFISSSLPSSVFLSSFPLSFPSPQTENLKFLSLDFPYNQAKSWFRRRRRKRPSSRFLKQSPPASTTAASPVTLLPTTCARSASPPPPPPPQPPPRGYRRLLNLLTTKPLDPTRLARPRGLILPTRSRRRTRRRIGQNRTKRRRLKLSGWWIDAPDAEGRSGWPDSGAGVESYSVPSTATPIATSAATTTKPSDARRSRGKIRWLKPPRSWRFESAETKGIWEIIIAQQHDHQPFLRDRGRILPSLLSLSGDRNVSRRRKFKRVWEIVTEDEFYEIVCVRSIFDHFFPKFLFLFFFPLIWSCLGWKW